MIFRNLPIAIFDIDGTIADVRWRRHHVEGGKADWKAFFEGIGDDPVVQPVAALFNAVRDSGRFNMYFVSGRPEMYRRATELWLTFNGLHSDRLLMRANGDRRADEVIKEEMLISIRGEGKSIAFAVDDRETVAAMWKRYNVLCFRVDLGSAHEP